MSSYYAYHLGLETGAIEGARIAFLPGDPGRVNRLAQIIDPDYRELQFHREYRTSWVNCQGVKAIVTSTGIGGPSTAIAVEELAQLGIKIFIRLGTTGAIQPDIALGDFIVATSAVRLEGTSHHYAPPSYPAVADWELVSLLTDACHGLNFKAHNGICASSDSFYPGQERYQTYNGYIIRDFQNSLEEWRRLNVLNYEMEAATLFTMASVFKLKAAAVLAVIAQRTETEQVALDIIPLVEEQLGRIARHVLGKIGSIA